MYYSRIRKPWPSEKLIFFFFRERFSVPSGPEITCDLWLASPRSDTRSDVEQRVKPSSSSATSASSPALWPLAPRPSRLHAARPRRLVIIFVAHFCRSSLSLFRFVVVATLPSPPLSSCLLCLTLTPPSLRAARRRVGMANCATSANAAATPRVQARVCFFLSFFSCLFVSPVFFSAGVHLILTARTSSSPPRPHRAHLILAVRTSYLPFPLLAMRTLRAAVAVAASLAALYPPRPCCAHSRKGRCCRVTLLRAALRVLVLAAVALAVVALWAV
jgi:hypothetical protein